MIKTTKWFRANGFFSQKWPESYIVIGGDGLGNEYFLDVTVEDSPVYLALHERCCSSAKLEYEQSDVNLETWIEAMRQTEITTPEWLWARALEEAQEQ